MRGTKEGLLPINGREFPEIRRPENWRRRVVGGKEAESSNSRNWDEAFHLFANVIASENDATKIQATIRLAKMSRHALENILALTVPILLELLESPPIERGPLVQEASAYCLKCIASQG
ncbi:hypothetical protein Salat_1502500 [Sesamum alatum]|uniref:Uncharacterized protein n=1 Tax=Sesamum alatum TaxID=300844 RepID=A0AAE1YCL6_9LAMI|nr:hypothetical protein Salat_1502500 [Sesamum alatum]